MSSHPTDHEKENMSNTTSSEEARDSNVVNAEKTADEDRGAYDDKSKGLIAIVMTALAVRISKVTPKCPKLTCSIS